MTEYGTPDEIWYMYRIEAYLIYKYEPHLVDTMMFTFGRARLRREEVVKEHDVVIKSADQLLDQVVQDLQSYAPWKPKRQSHKSSGMPRPGIGQGYQSQFNRL